MATKEIRGVQKIKVTIVGESKEDRDRKFKIIRDEMYNQWRALNLCMSLMATHNTLQQYNSGAENRLKAQLKKLDANIDKQQKIIDNPKTKEDKLAKAVFMIETLKEEKVKLEQDYKDKESHRTDIDVKFNEMYVKELYQIITKEFDFFTSNTPSLIVNRVKNDFGNSLAEYSRGERSLINYRRDNPLMLRGNSDSDYEKGKLQGLKFYYKDEGIYINWCGGIEFKVARGAKLEKNIQYQHTLHKLVNGEYKVSQSSLQFNKEGHLILNCNYRYNAEVKPKYIEGRVLGVDLGIAIPAYACLSDDTFIKRGFGCVEEFTKVRKQMNARRNAIQKSISKNKGGRGRKKKLKPLDRFKEKEQAFAKTYNHQISSAVVKFARDNMCQYIHLEKLTKQGFSDKLLGTWGYYQLQQMIVYKADRVGIEVRFVNPAYTSQKCSKCGHIARENRQTQSEFKCVECGHSLNADWNASINIGRSDEFMD